MARISLLPLILAPLLVASSAAHVAQGQSPIAIAQVEATRAEAEAARLTEAAGQARGQAARLAAERLAAAADIAAAEARISAADAELAAREALVRAGAARLAEKQAPVAALVAGVVNLGRRPPLVSLADERGLAELVRMRSLLDIAVPEIRRRTAALAGELEANRRLAAEAKAARGRIIEARASLARRQQKFAELESKSLDRAAALDAGAVGAGDQMIIAGEGVRTLGAAGDRARAARRMAGELAPLPAAPRRPFAPDSGRQAPPISFVLPVEAPVGDGMGAVSASGIRSRGTTFLARPGAPVIAPAGGSLVFAGPFRRHDGIAVIDHGGGWMCLLIGVRATAARGDRLKQGAPLGRALGPVSLECSTKGRPISAILAARPVQSLAIKANGG